MNERTEQQFVILNGLFDLWLIVNEPLELESTEVSRQWQSRFRLVTREEEESPSQKPVRRKKVEWETASSA